MKRLGIVVVEAEFLRFGRVVVRGDLQGLACGGYQPGLQAKDRDQRHTFLADGKGRPAVRLLLQGPLVDLQPGHPSLTPAVAEEIAVDRRQRLIRHHRRLLRAAFRPFGRAQAYPRFPGARQIDLEHVDSPRALDQVDAMMDDTDSDFFGTRVQFPRLTGVPRRRAQQQTGECKRQPEPPGVSPIGWGK